MISLKQLCATVREDPDHWYTRLMDFVDDFRFYKDLKSLEEPFNLTGDRLEAMLASTAGQLCGELGVAPPPWILEVPACKDPWFPSGLESLKAIALVESPAHFRVRKVFVMENFLSRV